MKYLESFWNHSKVDTDKLYEEEVEEEEED